MVVWCLLQLAAATRAGAEVPVLERGPDDALVCHGEGRSGGLGFTRVPCVSRLTAPGSETAHFPLRGSSFLL